MREKTHGLKKLLAPCDGITRIRFKGSAPKTFEALSAIGSPALYYL